MMNMLDNYRFVFPQLDTFVRQTWDEIRIFEPKVSCGYRVDTDNSITQTDLLHPYSSRLYTPYKVSIGIKSLISNMRGEYVRNDDFVHVLKSVFHELYHVRLQSRDYMILSSSSHVKDMAKVNIASRFFPEYYQFGYFRNPEEIACELYSMERIEQFFDANAVDFDWQSIVLDEVNSKYYFIGHADDYQSAKIQYYRHEMSSYYQPRINGFVKNLSIFSSAYDELDNCGLLSNICNAENGVEEVNIINNYIAEYHPEYFRGFRCIKDEYKVINLRNKVEDFADFLLDIKPQDVSDDFELGD